MKMKIVLKTLPITQRLSIIWVLCVKILESRNNQFNIITKHCKFMNN
jgi:hypothetical protein